VTFGNSFFFAEVMLLVLSELLNFFSASQRKQVCCAYFLSSVDPVTVCRHPIKICRGHLRWNNNEDRISLASDQLASK